MYREAKRGLALLTALLMVFSGSVSAFAGTSGTETVAASETAGDQTVTLPGMKATGDEESIALDVSAYDGTTAEVTVEGDVILETPEGEVVYINAEEASEVTLDVTGFVTGETDGYVIGVETQGSGSADVNVDISISVDSETGLATGIHDSGDSDLSMKVGYDVNAEGETGAFGIVSSGSGDTEAEKTIEVGRDVTASADGENAVVMGVMTQGTHDVTVKVEGDVRATAEKGEADGIEATNNGETTVNVGGDVTATGTNAEAIGINSPGEEDGRKTVTVEGNVVAEAENIGAGITVDGNQDASVKTNSSVLVSSENGQSVAIRDSGDGKTEIHTAGSVEAEGNGATGIVAEGEKSEGASSTITVADVRADSRNDTANGILADGEIGAKETTVIVDANVNGISVDGSAYGVQTRGEETNLTVQAAGSVTGTSENADAYGVKISSGGNNQVTAGGDVQAHGENATAVSLETQPSVIEGTAVVVVAESVVAKAEDDATGIAVTANGEKDQENTVKVEGDVLVEAQGDAKGVLVAGEAEASITVGKEIRADGTEQATGIEFNGTGTEDREVKKEVSVGEGVTATSEYGQATGVSVIGTGDVHATVEGSVEVTGSQAEGISLTEMGAGTGETDVQVKGDVSAKAENETAAGIRVTGDSASDQKEQVTVTGSVTATSDASAEGIAVSGETEAIVDAGRSVTAEAGERALGIIVYGNAEATVTVGEDVKAEGDQEARGIIFEGPGGADGSAERKVEVAGSVTATSKEGYADGVAATDTGDAQVKVEGDVTAEGQRTTAGIDLSPWNSEITPDRTVSVGGNVKAVSREQDATGIVVQRKQNAEVTVEGDVTAEGITAEGVHIAGNGDISSTVSVTGNILAVAEGEDYGWAEGVAVRGTGSKQLTVEGNVDAKGVGALGAGIYSQGIYYDTVQEEGTWETVPVEVKTSAEATIGGNLTAEGKDTAVGLDAGSSNGASVTVTVAGSVSVSSDGKQNEYTDGDGGTVTINNQDTGVNVFSYDGGSINVTIGEGITAASSKNDVTGLRVIATEAEDRSTVTVEKGGVQASTGGDGSATAVRLIKEDGDIQVSIAGDVTSTQDGIVINNQDSEESGKFRPLDAEGQIQINLAGNVTAEEGTAIAIRNEEEEVVRDESTVTVEVQGDVTGGDRGIDIDMPTEESRAEVLVDGTVSGGEHSIVLQEETAGDVTITVWKVEKKQTETTATGVVAERETVNRETGESTFVEDEKTEKQIQYIIRVAQPDIIRTEGTTEYKGYQVAREDDVVYMRLTLPEGFEVDQAYQDEGKTVTLLQDSRGEYYLAVPRGGGVMLSVTLKEIAEDEPGDDTGDTADSGAGSNTATGSGRAALTAEKAARIILDPNGGTMNGSDKPVWKYITIGRSFTLPEAPENDGYTFTGWYGTPYTKDDARWTEPEADSEKLKQAGETVTARWDMVYTAIWAKAEEEAAETETSEAEVDTAAEQTEESAETEAAQEKE